MKAFDLEAAKRGEPIVTRGGREAKFIAHVPELTYPVLILLDVGLWHAKPDGTSNVGRNNDLFMASKKQTVWVNFYRNQTNADYFSTKQLADYTAEFRTRIGGKAYPVEIEE